MAVVHVTQEMIDTGRRGSNDQCPIAIALMQTFPDWAFDVSNYSICKWRVQGDQTKMDWYPLPKWASTFVTMYDDMRSVAPFSFEFEL